jgi:hypothetical protein
MTFERANPLRKFIKMTFERANPLRKFIKSPFEFDFLKHKRIEVFWFSSFSVG